MSMPGFVFHIACPACHKTSPDYPLYVFPDLFGSDLLLPAWSSRFRCYVKMHFFLKPADRAALRENRQRLSEFVAPLSSPALTVGFPVWAAMADGIRVTVEPAPVCPFCGRPAEARSGCPPKQPGVAVQEVYDPYDVPLTMLGLSVRAFNGLRSAGIHNLGELCERGPADLLAIPQFSENTVREIRETVARTGCKLRGE
jgi:hypothetical protein